MNRETLPKINLDKVNFELTKEEEIDRIEEEVRKEHPSWNNADIRNAAVRQYYADELAVFLCP